MKKLIGGLFIFIFTSLFISCNQKTHKTQKIGVVVSIPPEVEVVKSIGQDKIWIHLMVKEGQSPHLYEPTPKDLLAISNAKIFLRIGAGIEFELAWWNKIHNANKKILVIDASKNVNLISQDPHIWTSPFVIKKIAINFTKALIDIDPDNKSFYEKNLKNYLEKLDKLIGKIQKDLKSIKDRSFLIYHPAFGYFARDFHLEQIPIEKKGKKVSIKRITYLKKIIAEKNIKYLFYSKYKPKDTILPIAKELNLTPIPINHLPLNYIEEMKDFWEKLKKELYE